MTYVRVATPSHGPTMTRVNQLVIHATVSPCRPGQAVNDAHYVDSVGLSCHYFVDPTTTVQQLDENVQGFHDGYNVDQIGIELCDPQAGPGSRWSDTAHEQMLVRAAALARGICQRWNIPMARVQADLRSAPTNGLCGHADATNTWHMSTHTDPGPDFPWDHFIALVNQTSTPKPAPAPAPPAPPAPPTGGLTMADIDALLAAERLALYGDRSDGKGPSAANDVPSNLKLNTLLNQVLGTLDAQGKTLAALQAQVAAKP